MPRLTRFFVIALILTSAAVAVSAEEDDVDRTDFSDPALSEDVKVEAEGPHSDIEPAWVIPDAPDGKIPIGGVTDLVVAMANSGSKSKMFNMSHIVGKLLDKSGAVFKDLGRYEYGQPLGPNEQRSFRYPMELEPDTPLGEYTLVATAYYADKQKSPFFHVVVNEAAELVPALPKKGSGMRMVQLGLGGVSVLLLVVLVGRVFAGGAPAAEKKAASKKPSSGEGNGAPANEWLTGTLAGSESKASKKTKKK